MQGKIGFVKDKGFSSRVFSDSISYGLGQGVLNSIIVITEDYEESETLITISARDREVGNRGLYYEWIVKKDKMYEVLDVLPIS